MYQCVHSQSTERNQAKHHQNKPLDDKIEVHNDKQYKTTTSNEYSSSKANEFLSYDKCMQRMRCPVNRKEDCSEECQAGNTEEEIEEHEEMINNEHRNSLSKRPKPKFDDKDMKQQSTKNRRSSENKQSSINSNDQSKIKIDL